MIKHSYCPGCKRYIVFIYQSGYCSRCEDLHCSVHEKLSAIADRIEREESENAHSSGQDFGDECDCEDCQKLVI